jgi:hypothetical protein
MLGGDLPGGDPTFGQPVAEVCHQADLELRRLLGVAFGVHFSGEGLKVRTQRALMQALNCSGISEKVMGHVSPPCEMGYWEETPNYAGRATPEHALDWTTVVLPGIVRSPE